MWFFADKMFAKAVEDYDEKAKRKVMVITEFDKKPEIVVSTKVAKKLEKKQRWSRH